MMILDPNYRRPPPKGGALVRNRPPELFAADGHSMYGTEYSALGSIARLSSGTYAPPIVQEEYNPGRMNRNPPPRTSDSVRLAEQEFCLCPQACGVLDGVTRVAPRGREPEYPVVFDPKVTLAGGPIHNSLQRNNCPMNLDPRGHYNTPNTPLRTSQVPVCESVSVMKNHAPLCNAATPFAYNPQVKEQRPVKPEMTRLHEPCGGVAQVSMGCCGPPRDNCNRLVNK